MNTKPSDTNKLIFEKIPLIMRDLEPIGKLSFNKQQNFKYRSIESICDQLQPLLAKHGVFIIPLGVVSKEYSEKCDKRGNQVTWCRITKKYAAIATDSSYIEGIGVGEGLDYSDKSIGKASTYAYKDFINQLFCIPFSQPDPDSSYIEVNNNNSLKIAKKELARELEEIAKTGDTHRMEVRLNNLTHEEKQLISRGDKEKLEGVKDYYSSLASRSKDIYLD